MPAPWHVLVTRPATELSTAARLILAGHRAVAPVRQVWHRPVRYLRKQLTDQPLLAGYIFAAGPVENWRAVLDTRGVRGVLTVDGAPAVVPQDQIERLMLAGGKAPIAAGDVVGVERGPLAGQRIEVLDVDELRRQVRTSVELFGSLRPVAVSIDMLAAA